MTDTATEDTVKAAATLEADAFGHAAAEAEDGIECVGCTD